MRDLGFWYVVCPVGLNVVILLVAAVAFNWPLAWRRYPAALSTHGPHRGKLTDEDWRYALSHLPSMADVSEEDLITLHRLATEHAAQRIRPSRKPPTTL